MTNLWRRMRVALVSLAIYALAVVIFTVVLPHEGLVSPAGTIDRVSAAATVLMVCLRMAVLFVLVPSSVYRLVVALWPPWAGAPQP